MLHPYNGVRAGVVCHYTIIDKCSRPCYNYQWQCLGSACFLSQTIKPAHIATVRKLGKPPHLIMRIMDCVLLLFQKRVDASQLDPDRPGPKPSWSESLKLMAQTGFLAGLQNYAKDSINEEMVELMMPYFDMEDYNMETAAKVCTAYMQYF